VEGTGEEVFVFVVGGAGDLGEGGLAAPTPSRTEMKKGRTSSSVCLPYRVGRRDQPFSGVKSLGSTVEAE
jgi:hypothetical protein